MSLDQAILGLVAALPPTITAFFAWRASRRAAQVADTAKTAVLEVHADVNGRLSQLIEEVRASSHARGVSDEKKRREREEP